MAEKFLAQYSAYLEYEKRISAIIEVSNSPLSEKKRTTNKDGGLLTLRLLQNQVVRVQMLRHQKN